MGTYTPDDWQGPGYQPQPPVPLTPPQILPPPQRNVTRPPGTPETFTVSNRPGSQAQHPMAPENYDTPPTPGAVQTAQAPPTPAKVESTASAPTPGNYTPVPWHQPQAAAVPKLEPPADQMPPLGGWKAEDTVPPWVTPTTHLGPVPNRDPDGYSGGRPVWNPRPGEPGYDAPRPHGARYTFPEMLGLALQAGFKGQAAYTAAAVGMAESSGEAGQITYKDGGKPFNSYGLMQINGSNDATLASLGGARAALNPLTSFKAAYILSKGGTDFSPWTMFNNGGYKQYLDVKATPVEGHPIAGPVQNYREPQERPPAQWGKEPEHDWKPGGMPQAHDVPGIMKGLLPLILTVGLGFAGKGALGAVTAFGAYQNARNKSQLEEAKHQKNLWQDHLKETTSRLQEELLGAAGVIAQYGYDTTSPQAQAAWQRLAANFEDEQLRNAIANGDSGAIKRLFDNRDKVYQTLSKTSAAQAKADEQRSEKDAGVGAEQAPYPGEESPPPAGLPGERPPQPAAPAGRGFEEPPGAPQPFAPVARPPQSTGPAGVTPPAPGATSRPAAASPSASPEEPPSSPEATPPADAAAPEEPQHGEDTVVPGPEGAVARPQPVLAAQRTEQPLPEVGVGGLQPWDNRGPLGQSVTGLSPERLDQEARTYLESGKEPYHGGPSGDPLAIYRNEAIKRRSTQMQAYIDKVVRETPPGHLDDALQKIDTIDPNLAQEARLIDRGDKPAPSGWQRGVPFYRNAQRIVSALDPTWSAARWVTNYRTQIAYDSGTQSVQVASINRALQHMTILMDAAKRLPNGEWTDFNGLRNFIAKHLGSDGATNFMTARAAVARELERAFRGGSGAYAEIKADLDNVSASGSPEQILGYIRTSTELLKGQLDALADLYQRGTRKPTTGNDLLTPGSRATYERIMKQPLPQGAKVEGDPPPAEIDPNVPYPPSNAYGPGPAPSGDMPPGWSEQPQQ